MKIADILLKQIPKAERLYTKLVTPKRLKLAQRLILLAALTALAGLIAGAIWYFRTHTVAVFASEGHIADRQRELIYFALLLSLVVVVPVFVLLGIIIWRYRASNTKAKYSPHLDGNRALEFIWWAIPSVLIVILSVVTWRASHELDPYKPLTMNAKPVTVQVVALQWKWLFIYPEEGIATVNYLQVPEKTPINFQITSDAPMNSFWIPQLGGQVYAMSGMNTKLHLIADHVGTYDGSSANISGEGFASMRFKVDSRTATDYHTWTQQIRAASPNLTAKSYDELAKPSKFAPVTYYGSVEPNLYDTIVMKYMAPDHHGTPAKREY